jgi:chromosome segregation ATPase
MANEIVGLKIQVDGSEATRSVGSLKQQLREAQADVTKLSEKFGATSQEAVNAAKKAADLRDRIGDAKSLTDAFNPDAKFRAFTSTLLPYKVLWVWLELKVIK